MILRSRTLCPLVAALVVLCGCRSMERGMIVLSRVKSPITVGVPKVNKPFDQRDLTQAGIVSPTPVTGSLPVNPHGSGGGVRLDDLSDLAGHNTTVAVCLSGGGARAARMAAHALALLEQEYNRQADGDPKSLPLVQQIDLWSSVSGGSIYASYVATALHRGAANARTFSHLETAPKIRLATQRLGAVATVFYLWPGNMGYAPVMLLLTEWDLLNLFARTHAMFQEGRLPILPISRLSTLGDLPPQPRFFFNATCLETGRPLIFTQSVLHRDLSWDPMDRLGPDPLVAWAEGQTSRNAAAAEPLRHASTLEDLGSSPARFPVAYAVMASAAFPGVFQPLELEKYRWVEPMASGSASSQGQWQKQGRVRIVDGGIYDNTGISTVLELFAYLRQRSVSSEHRTRLLLLAVDAEIEPDSYRGPLAHSSWPVRFDLPLRGLLPAVSTVSGLYSKAKSLVRAALDHRIKALSDEGLVDFYQVRLLDSELHAKALRKIPTDFVISDEEDHVLKAAVVELLAKPRAEGDRQSLAAAFAQAVRAASRSE